MSSLGVGTQTTKSQGQYGSLGMGTPADLWEGCEEPTVSSSALWQCISRDKTAPRGKVQHR